MFPQSKNSNITVQVKVYTLSGVNKLDTTLNLAAHASHHFIMDNILLRQKGIAIVTVSGQIPDSAIATAMQYSYNTNSSIKTIYGIQAKQALGNTLIGSYNTYIYQDCSLFIVNPTSSVRTTNVKMVRLDGTTILPGIVLNIPARGGQIPHRPAPVRPLARQSRAPWPRAHRPPGKRPRRHRTGVRSQAPTARCALPALPDRPRRRPPRSRRQPPPLLAPPCASMLPLVALQRASQESRLSGLNGA